MIKPLNPHYSMENPASIYDEEALTALELAGRTAGKVNEVVTEVNKFTEGMTVKHNKLVQSVPGLVADNVQSHIDSGAFDQQIDKHMGNLKERIDNVVANGSDECVDIRVGPQGFTYNNAGNAVREQYEQAVLGGAGFYKLYTGSINSEDGAFYFSTTNRVVSSLIDVRQLLFIQSNSADYHFRLFYYDKNLVYIGHSSWTTFEAFDNMGDSVKYIRFVVARVDEADTTPEDVELAGLMVCTRDYTERMGYKPVTVPFVNGTVTGEGDVAYRDNRLVSPLMPVNFVLGVPGKNAYTWHMLIAFYDADMTFMGCSEFTYKPVTPYTADIAQFINAGAKYMRVVARVTDNLVITPEDKPVITLYVNDSTMLEEWNQGAPAFLHETMNIAYSDVNLAPINGQWHFKCAAHMGFNALKGDVRITANEKLVMSHDAGFTVDGDGHVTDFNPDNCTLWSEYDFDENDPPCFAEKMFTVNYPIIQLKDYLRTCIEAGKIAYITLRNVNIPTLVEKVLETVTNMGMIDRCVINSYTYQTLETVRKYNRRIPVSLVLEHGAPLTHNHVTKVHNLGNGIVTLFYYPDESAVYGKNLLENTASVIERAHRSGVVVHMAQVNSTTQLKDCMEYGITGAHIIRCILPYSPKAYHLIAEVTGDTFTVSEKWNLMDINTSQTTGTIEDGVGWIGISNGVVSNLMNKVPYVLYVSSMENPNARVYYDQNCIWLAPDGVDGTYNITIIV